MELRNDGLSEDFVGKHCFAIREGVCEVCHGCRHRCYTLGDQQFTPIVA